MTKALSRVLLALSVVALLAAVPTAQSQLTSKALSTTTCPGAGCVVLGTSGVGGLGVQVTGTFSGTLTFEGSIDGVTFSTLNLTPVNSTTATTTTTTTGVWSGGVGGLATVRVRFSAYSSGTAVVTLQNAPTTARGGTGGAAVVVGSNRQIPFNNNGVMAADSGLQYYLPGQTLRTKSISNSFTGANTGYLTNISNNINVSGANAAGEGVENLYNYTFFSGDNSAPNVNSIDNVVIRGGAGASDNVRGVYTYIGTYDSASVTNLIGLDMPTPLANSSVPATNVYGIKLGNYAYSGSTINRAIDVNGMFIVGPTGGFLNITEVAYASLPSGVPTGAIANVSDSNTATWGATVAGGGANHVLARYNGTNWTVVGI